MGFNQSAKEEIKRAADIVEIIGQVVQLKKAGKNYVGLCPFHAEKDPSFTVNPERQTFHCFGCKKGGDIFSFWMEYHGSSFPEALRDLAERYSVTISEEFSTPVEKKKAAQREIVFKITEAAATFFQEVLSHPAKGRPGREYFDKRALSKEIIGEFRLGYAPDEWNGLVGFLKRNRLDLKMGVQAGVIIPNKKGGYYDRFRGRIMFPIFDLRNHVVGFGGRVLDDSLPKYLNTPETDIFHKSESLYGLHSSFKAIREKGRAVIVEGYMDYLALRGHGFGEVAATLGTALTDRHVRKLKGYAKEAVIVFDSDEAGKAAVLKSLPVFANEGLSARAVVLPNGHDPDSFVNENGLNGFLGLLGETVPIFDFFLEQKTAEAVSDEGSVQILKEVIPALSEVRNDIIRSIYVRRLSEKLGVREEMLWSELRGFMKNQSGRTVEKGFKQRLNASKAESKITDLQMINLLLYYPRTISRLMDGECRILLSDPVALEIIDTIFEKFLKEGTCSAEDLSESLGSEAAREQLREILHRPFIVYSDQDVELAVLEFEQKASRKKFLASLNEARGDAEAQSRLIKSKFQRS